MTKDWSIIIKSERERRGWTQQYLADLVGVTEGHISKLEAKEREPSLDLLDKLCRALELEILVRNR